MPHPSTSLPPALDRTSSSSHLLPPQVDTDLGLVVTHTDTWDAIKHQSFISLEGLIFVLRQALTVQLTPQLESLRFSLLKKTADYELRKQEPYVVAATPMGPASGPASGVGFNQLASYIFGNNEVRCGADLTSACPGVCNVSFVAGARRGATGHLAKLSIRALVFQACRPLHQRPQPPSSPSSTHPSQHNPHAIPPQAQVQMDMTTPVLSRVESQQQGAVMEFLMGSRYTGPDQLPKPLNSSVSVQRVEGSYVAVARFSG